jgi:hypothetical protein
MNIKRKKFLDLRYHEKLFSKNGVKMQRDSEITPGNKASTVFAAV